MQLTRDDVKSTAECAGPNGGAGRCATDLTELKRWRRFPYRLRRLIPNPPNGRGPKRKAGYSAA